MAQTQQDIGKKIESLYDALPYDSYTYFKLQPDILNLLASSHGISAPDHNTARILEVGCACGGHLIPYASQFPDSHCVGIDISEEEIKIANATKESLKVENINFIKRNVLEMNKADDGEFDYIIMHGLLSWVPENVQKKLIQLCDELLTPHGIAVISYNALPGWNAVKSLREMMSFETRNTPSPEAKAKNAKKFLGFLARNASEHAPGYKTFIQHEDTLLSGTFDSFILHDHIGTVNAPRYLHEFIDELQPYDLQFICDVDIKRHFTPSLTPEAKTWIKNAKTRIEKLQIVDFINNARFNISLITKSKETINDTPSKNIFSACHLSINIEPPSGDLNLDQEIEWQKKGGDQENINVTNKALNELLLELYYKGPAPITIDTAINNILKETGQTDDKPYRDVIRSDGPTLIDAGYVTAFPSPQKCIGYVSDKPLTNAFTRWQAKAALASAPMLTNKVTTALRGMSTIDRYMNYALIYCDGTHTQDDIIQKMEEHFNEGNVSLNDQNGLPLTDKIQQKIKIASLTSTALNQLASGNVFVG